MIRDDFDLDVADDEPAAPRTVCDCDHHDRHELDCPRRHERARWVAPGGDDPAEDSDD